MEEKVIKLPHGVNMEDRNRLRITGVTDVGRFDEDSVTVFTSYGELTVRGEKIQVTQLSIEKGELAAEGTFTSLTYTEASRKGGSLFSKLVN